MTSASTRFQSYWWVVIAAAILVSVTMGTRQAFGLYMPSFSEINGTGREFFGLAIALQNLLWGVASPIAGGLADKYGCGRVAIWGSLVYGLGLLAMSASIPLGLFGGQFLIGLGLAGGGFSVALGAIGKNVPAEKRTFALGVGSAGGSFGQFALVPISDVLAIQLGWAAAFACLAGMAVALMLPSSFVLKNYDVRLATKSLDRKLKDVLSEAFRNADYVLLTLGFFVCGLQVAFVATHLPGYLADHNISSTVASWALSLIGLFNIFGTLICGWLGTRYSKKNCLSILYVLRSAVIIVFISAPPTPISTLVFSACLGLVWLGTVPLTSGLVAHFFGPVYMSMLYGFVFLSHQMGSFMGAWMGGFLYDANANYLMMWYITVIMGLVAAVLHLPIKEKNYVMVN
ncbi:MAG: MFS transporter [Candidatus Portiera sp.]|nr:MFS transporter [Portiera sp.]